jgi:hypothetical protein
MGGLKGMREAERARLSRMLSGAGVMVLRAEMAWYVHVSVKDAQKVERNASVGLITAKTPVVAGTSNTYRGKSSEQPGRGGVVRLLVEVLIDRSCVRRRRAVVAGTIMAIAPDERTRHSWRYMRVGDTENEGKEEVVRFE